jgi:hypothetical protein
MITKDEVFDIAMRTALQIMATPHAIDVVTKIERVILDAYERGMNETAEMMISTQVAMDLKEVTKQ